MHLLSHERTCHRQLDDIQEGPSVVRTSVLANVHDEVRQLASESQTFHPGALNILNASLALDRTSPRGMPQLSCDESNSFEELICTNGGHHLKHKSHLQSCALLSVSKLTRHLWAINVHQRWSYMPMTLSSLAKAGHRAMRVCVCVHVVQTATAKTAELVGQANGLELLANWLKRGLTSLKGSGRVSGLSWCRWSNQLTPIGQHMCGVRLRTPNARAEASNANTDTRNNFENHHVGGVSKVTVSHNMEGILHTPEHSVEMGAIFDGAMGPLFDMHIASSVP